MQSFGGISRYYKILAEELIKLGHDINIFAGMHRNHYLDGIRAEVVKGFKIPQYPPKTSRIFAWVNHGLAEALMRNWRPDIIHETYYSSLPRLNNKSFRVTTVYDMIHELFPDQFSVRDKTTERKKSTFSRVNHIISISESTKRDLIDLFGISDEKISVVHLGVDFSAFMNARSTFNYTHKPYILFVGNRGGYKNFDGFLKAFASSERLKADFDIVAFGGGSFIDNEKTLFKTLGLKEAQVRHVGGDDQKLASVYSMAHVFVYPSLYEGFGLPPLEAMASGCPVISSNTSSMPEVVGVAGEYFNPSVIEDMRHAIERVVYSDQRRIELVNLGYENIKNFSWHDCARKTLEVYKEVIG